MPTKNKQKQSREEASKTEKTEKTESEKRFVRDLLIRGEAVKPSPDGELPPGATHKIVENNNDESAEPEVERERFSIC